MTVKLQLDENPLMYEKIQDQFRSEKYQTSRVWLDVNYYIGLERWFLKVYDFKLVTIVPRFMSDGNHMADVRTPYIEFENDEQLLEFKLKML